MKKIKQNVFAGFCLFSVLLCAAACTSSSKMHGQKAPRWISEPSSVYPDNAYLTAAGYAFSRRDAEAAAVAVLTKSIKQKVEAHSSSVQTMEAGTQNVHRGFSSTIQTSSNIDNITGVTIKEIWNAADGTVYALALINREEVGAYYEEQIKNTEDGINAFILFAAENPASFEAVSALNKAAIMAEQNEELLSLLSVIHPEKYKRLSLAYKNAQTVKGLLFRETEKIDILVDVENDKNNRLNAAFLQAFKQTGFKARSAVYEPDSTVPYTLKARLSFEPFDGKRASENKYVRYVLKADLTDMRTGKIVLPWSTSGREAHFTQNEAENRALRTLEDEIKTAFLNKALKIGS